MRTKKNRLGCRDPNKRTSPLGKYLQLHFMKKAIVWIRWNCWACLSLVQVGRVRIEEPLDTFSTLRGMWELCNSTKVHALNYVVKNRRGSTSPAHTILCGSWTILLSATLAAHCGCVINQVDKWRPTIVHKDLLLTQIEKRPFEMFFSTWNINR